MSSFDLKFDGLLLERKHFQQDEPCDEKHDKDIRYHPH